MEIKGQIWILYHALLKKQTKPMSTMQMQRLLLSLKLKDINDFFIWTPGWNEWQPLVNFVGSSQTFFVLTAIPSPPKKEGREDIQIAELLDEKTLSKLTDLKIYNDDETKDLFMDYQGDHQFTLVDTAKPTVKSTGDEFGYFAADFRAEDIDVNAAPSLKDNHEGSVDSNRRSADRHNFKLEIILISKNGKTFKTFSKNISLGGTLLEDPVPKDFLNGEFEMMITNRFEADKTKGRLHFKAKIVGDFKNPQRLTFKEANKMMMEKLESLLRAYVVQQKELENKRKPKE